MSQSKIMKASMLIGRICEDYTSSDHCTIRDTPNFVELIFSWDESGEIISYRIQQKFYQDNLKSIFQEEYSKSIFFNFHGK